MRTGVCSSLNFDMTWLFSRSTGVLLLLLAGLGLLSTGLALQFGWPAAAMVTGLSLLWAGARASKDLR